MGSNTPLGAQLLDDAALTLDELAQACGVEPEWVHHHVQAGVLGAAVHFEVADWRFGSADLYRARHLLRIERAFDANADLAALVVDLGDEIHRLRARLAALGAR